MRATAVDQEAAVAMGIPRRPYLWSDLVHRGGDCWAWWRVCGYSE